MSEFVISAAREAAARTIEEVDVIRLSVAGQRAFAEALVDPPAPSKQLQKTFAAHRRLIREVK